MRINPAERLEMIEKKIDKLHMRMIELEADGVEPIEERLQVKALNNEFENEFDKAYNEYLRLFQDYIYCTEDIQSMLDLDVQMVTKKMSSELESIHFSKIMRRHIKSCRINKTHDDLELLLYKQGIDIDKKVFFSKASLINWLVSHVFTRDEVNIPPTLAYEMIKDKRVQTVVSTVNYKNRYNIKYDMQLKRINRERLYFHMDVDTKRKLSRIPLDAHWDAIIIKLNEL